MLQDLAQFRSVILEKKASKTYKVLEREFGVNRWYLWQIIHDENYQPPTHICATLGIAKYEPVPVCPVHGIPHCFDCQTQTVKQKAEPKPPKQAARLPRYKSWLWDVPQKEIVAMLENRKEL